MKQRRPGEMSRILIVEDDDLLRLTIADFLGEEGFRTRQACCAEEALSLLEKPGIGDEIAALVTDVDMPGALNGVGLAALVHESWPHIGIVVTSGAHSGAALLLREPAIFLPKPFGAERLIAAVRTVIEPQFAAMEQRRAS